MSAGELIMWCFHARTTAHVLHLRTRSYAAHKALNDFYDGIVGLADSYAEGYQGKYGLIEEYPKKYTFYDDPIKLVSDLCEWIEKNRKELGDSSYLQNIVDEIVALCEETRYKLRFLR